MPAMVSELPKSYTYERDGSGGRVADTAQRQWRILLSTPHEAYEVQQAIGVKIGDRLSTTNPLPCVNISVAADGDNRMVQIVTARYASTPGEARSEPGSGGSDPGNEAPDQRLSVFNISTSMTEIPSWTWYKVSGAGAVQGGRQAAKNPAGDMYDGVARIEPITVISIEQFDYPVDPIVHCQNVGKVNSNQITWRGLTIPRRCLLFRGIDISPQNLYWGDQFWRGWKSKYEFAFRRNQQSLGGGGDAILSECGWDAAIPQSGFNYLADGERKRATVKLVAEGIEEEIPSAQPVALNDNGSIRPVEDGVLVYRYGYHDEADFSVAFQHLRVE